jgi:hypothetical protein
LKGQRSEANKEETWKPFTTCHGACPSKTYRTIQGTFRAIQGTIRVNRITFCASQGTFHATQEKCKQGEKGILYNVDTGVLRALYKRVFVKGFLRV